jgi:hypothetical protein
MAFPANKSVQSLEDSDAPTKESSAFSGPPPASPKPRSATDSSLLSTAGKTSMEAGQGGLGQEGSSPALIGVQGMALIQRGIQMVNLAFPENPGLVAVLGGLTGRLQTMIPQLVAGSSNPGMGLLSQMAARMPQPVPNMAMGPGGMPPGGPMPPGAGGPVGPPMAPPMPMQ